MFNTQHVQQHGNSSGASSGSSSSTSDLLTATTGVVATTAVATLADSSTGSNLLSQVWVKFIQVFKSLSVGHFYLFLGSLGLGTFWYTTFNYFIQRSLVSKLYIGNNDDAFHWFMFWLAENKYSQESNHFTVLSSKTHFDFSSFKHNPSEKDKHSIPPVD